MRYGSNKLVTVRHVDVWMEGRYAIICSVLISDKMYINKHITINIGILTFVLLK
jgi:hypothetical protein